MSLNENLMGVLKHRKLVLNADFFMPTHFLQPMTRGGESASHSMATANLKKSEDFVANTTAASKYIQQGLEIRCFWFQKKTVQLKTALHEVYIYVLKGIFFQKTV